MSDPFANYDAWLEEPYQRRYREAEESLCPECNEASLEVDKAEECVTCPACGYSYGTDWDAVAERRYEERYGY